eukprot:SAG31_NODE_17197_length_679_cov_1.256897_1_plen_91_part_00
MALARIAVLMLFLATSGGSRAAPTTVVIILADDVDDTLLPLSTVMTNLHTMVQQTGVTFSNSFVTTAVCCSSQLIPIDPNRSQLIPINPN